MVMMMIDNNANDVIADETGTWESEKNARMTFYGEGELNAEFVRLLPVRCSSGTEIEIELE